MILEITENLVVRATELGQINLESLSFCPNHLNVLLKKTVISLFLLNNIHCMLRQIDRLADLIPLTSRPGYFSAPDRYLYEPIPALKSQKYEKGIRYVIT